MSDDTFLKRHCKHEKRDQIRKKLDLKQIRELPSPSNVKAIKITKKLPVSASGYNLYELT